MHRRAFLGGAAAGAASGLAGCSGILGDNTGEGGTSPAPLAAWAPARVQNPDQPYNFEISAVQPRAALDAAPALAPSDLDAGLPPDSVAWAALDAADLDRVVQLAAAGAAEPENVAVFEGDVDPEAVVAALDDRPNYAREHVGSYRGYEIHDTGAGFFFHALRPGRVIEIDRYAYPESDRSTVETAIDLGEGDRQQLTDDHEGFAAVLERLDPTHWTSARLEDPDRETDAANGRFAGVVASGASSTLEDGGATATGLLAFRDAATRRSAPTERYLEAARSEAAVESVDATADGRIFETTLRLNYPAPFVTG